MVEQMPGTESGNESGYVQEGWRVAHLGALGTVRYGLGQPPEQDTDGLPMIRATNIKRGRIVADGLIRIKKSAIPESRDPYLRSGDIIVVRSGAYTGDLAMVTPEWEGCVAGYDLVLLPSNRVDPEFCAFALLSGPIQTYFRSQRDRSAQPHLNRQQLESAGLPLPPLPEQRAIAQILRAVQRAKEATEKVIAATRQLKTSMMRHLFTYGPVPVADADQVETRESELGLIPRDWNTGRLRDLATKITKGSSPKWQGYDYCVAGTTFVRSQNIGWGRLDLSEVAHLPESFNESHNGSVVKSKDVLVNLVGASIGRVAMADERIEGANLNQAVGIVRLKGELEPQFLVSFLLSVTTGSTSSGASYFAVEALIFALHMESPEGAPLSVKVGCSQIQHRLRA